MAKETQKKPKKQYPNDDLVRAVSLLESLEYVADGEGESKLDQWDASCLLLLIEDADYRKAVQRKYAKLHGND